MGEGLSGNAAKFLSENENTSLSVCTPDTYSQGSGTSSQAFHERVSGNEWSCCERIDTAGFLPSQKRITGGEQLLHSRTERMKNSSRGLYIKNDGCFPFSIGHTTQGREWWGEWLGPGGDPSARPRNDSVNQWPGNGAKVMPLHLLFGASHWNDRAI
jgi:hypothetical protein